MIGPCAANRRRSMKCSTACGVAAALSEFQAEGPGHDLESLATTLLRAEALLSSFIEGLRASNKRLALAAYEPVAADPTARAVLGNVRAMERAIKIGAERRAFRLDDLIDIHETLLEGTTEARVAGIVRAEQNWIGGRGTSPRDAAFIPPPADRVRQLLDDLVAFVNLDDLPAIWQAAIATPSSRPSTRSATATAAPVAASFPWSCDGEASLIASCPRSVSCSQRTRGATSRDRPTGGRSGLEHGSRFDPGSPPTACQQAGRNGVSWERMRAGLCI